jgi:hypothetical protein
MRRVGSGSSWAGPVRLEVKTQEILAASESNLTCRLTPSQCDSDQSMTREPEKQKIIYLDI